LNKSITLISAGLLFAMVGAATEEPRYEVYLGYQWVRTSAFNQRVFNENTGLLQDLGNSFDMHGGDANFVYNFNNWASGVIDAGGVNRPNIGFNNFALNLSNTTAFVYGGPRFYLRRHNTSHFRFQPFGQVLFGAAFRHLRTDVNAVTAINTPNLPVVTPLGVLFPGPLTLVNAQLTNSDNAFSMKVGGGLDWKFNKHIGFRLPEVNYILTRFPGILTGNRENQNSISASAGIIFTWGAQ
jgi:hypothetical protein